MDNKHYLIWLVLYAGFAIWAWIHIKQNGRLKFQLGKNIDSATAQSITRLAWSRTIQLLVALTCGISAFIIYDWQLAKTQMALDETTIALQTAQSTQPATTASKIPQTSPAQPARPQQPTVAQAPAQIVHPVTNANPAPVAQPAPVRPAATVDDVYNPEKKSNDTQSHIDAIKKRYEDILVIYLFLNKCGKATQSDYQIIARAMTQEIATAKANSRLATDIVNSAQGSFNEVYSRSSCTGNEVITLQTQYNDYVKALAANYPPK